MPEPVRRSEHDGELVGPDLNCDVPDLLHMMSRDDHFENVVSVLLWALKSCEPPRKCASQFCPVIPESETCARERVRCVGQVFSKEGTAARHHSPFVGAHKMVFLSTFPSPERPLVEALQRSRCTSVPQ